jgi:hypothetical protein
MCAIEVAELRLSNGVAGRFPCCYPVIAMAIKKSKLDLAVNRAAVILQEHIEGLPPAEAKAMLKDLRNLAVKSARSATRGKTLRARRSGGPRPLSRASAKPA